MIRKIPEKVSELFKELSIVLDEEYPNQDVFLNYHKFFGRDDNIVIACSGSDLAEKETIKKPNGI